MRCSAEFDLMQHTQETTELSTSETVTPDARSAPVFTEPESAIRDLPPLRIPTNIKRQKAYNYDKYSAPVVPPTHENRTLVLCFDGTGDQFDGDNSNVVRLCSLLKKGEQDKQMVYYQSGIGTASPQTIIPFASAASKTLDQMIAYSLDTQVMEGYKFLMQSYTRGDRICMFGFSRGAYTARALAGMLHKVGLLPPNNHQQVPFAYKLYTDTSPTGWDQSNAFKRSFSVDVEIEFLGVWDTVNSVGIIPRRLPFTTSNTLVKTFRHALALDERRAKFQPNTWNRPTEEELRLGEGADKPVPKTPPPTRKGSPKQTIRSKMSRLGIGNSNTMDIRDEGWFSIGKRKPTSTTSPSDIDKGELLLSQLERVYSERDSKPTDVKEVWFAGCHCDVGGGSVPNTEEHSLSRIPLRWMIRECFLANTGIMFDVEGLKSIGMDAATLWPLVLPRPPPLSPTSWDLPVERVTDTSFHTRFSSFFSHKRSKYMKERLSSEYEVLGEHEHDAFGELKAGEEQLEELFDALSPAYDQLKMYKFWWTLECIPMELKHQRSDDTWVSRMAIHLGRPRKIVDQKNSGIHVHRSVKMRMNAPHSEDRDGTIIPKRYKPKARFKDPIWVD